MCDQCNAHPHPLTEAERKAICTGETEKTEKKVSPVQPASKGSDAR